jgi:hypothetical protein
MLCGMKKLALLLVLGAALVVIPAAGASPTIRLAIIHVMRGCHVWATQSGTELGAARTFTVKPGTRIEIRMSCPMAFDVTQLAGPRLALGDPRWQPGTSHVLVFKKKGVYRLQAVNVQTPQDLGLETMGPDNHPTLTVRVR